MKNRFVVAAVLLISIVVMVIFLMSGKSTKGKSSPRDSSTGQSDNSSSASQKNSGNAPSLLAAGGNPASTETQPANLAAHAGEVGSPPETATNVPPAIILENVRRAIRQYGDLFGGNPVGTNPEITSALNGNNPKQINFIKPEYGMQINGNGELVDAWGTPLFFHQLSGTDMEIHSAGPDKTMWTLDDLVTK